ncbi:MAG: hypothetical protein JSV62_13080 [Promethearchaeota archaeon]|nr:MAG: hypothetical protein JSV62_13080 [Candidatus Lokiarchaeota archaeon]
MLLEKVVPHPHRDEIYINEIIIPHGKITQSDRQMVNRILLKEIARRGIEISA